MTASKNRDVRTFLPVAVAAGFTSAFGLAKTLFALHSLYAATVVGPKVGPPPLIALSSVDLVIGVVALVAGFAFVLRRRWARETLVYGWFPVILYEIGRGLGLAVVGLTLADVQGVALSLLMVAALALAGLCARSRTSEAYVNSRAIPAP
jgi:hypothetical protein